MSETSNYLSNSDDHFYDVDNCIIRTSLKLHAFGRRFYSCRYWSPDDDRACKFFKWLDTSICCKRGAATASIVIAKFRRLEHVVEGSEHVVEASTCPDTRNIGKGASCKGKG
ncbi:hypothetical protein SO802_003951 [Lithocarpus litseifolius]|uniref:Zinc finger GRF-type domain-containing protein n=1 Tax=Lithocarpus litseifolius TaxID=425828 RepID=A0AAW2E1H1_9ROSI